MQSLKRALVALIVVGTSLDASAQKIEFNEYDLPNGLHVILHIDHHAPVVSVSVMYHVGSKNEMPGRTGFAHFFEHLLFEGSENIKRGEFTKIVSANGGVSNANTTQDRTFYYEVFPSNHLEIGLWLESERMMHPVINEIGVKTQVEVVKEERRQKFDSRPYGNFINAIAKGLFVKHPYHNGVIGEMKDIDSASLDEFKMFFKQYYTPNNAVLVVSGDIDTTKAKSLIYTYFGSIPRGPGIVFNKIKELQTTEPIIDTFYDANIQLLLVAVGYRIPGSDSRDAKIIQMISNLLSQGGSSRLYKKMVDDKKDASRVAAFIYSLEDYGMYVVGALPNNATANTTLLKDIDDEMLRLQQELISEDEYEKLQNMIENNYINANSSQLGIAENLANGYTFYHKDTDMLNKELSIYKSITREEIRNVARKFLNANQRVTLFYLPKIDKTNTSHAE